MTLSAVVITRDESSRIAACLNALSFCDERIVIDSESKDRTAEIAKALGAKVFIRRFDDFSSQKNFGIDKATSDWVLLIDADERVADGGAKEIKQGMLKNSIDGYYFKRKNRIFGRWMRFGINSGDLQLRLVRRSMARFQGVVHERVYLPEDRTSTLKVALLHDSTPTISAYMRKLNGYSRLEADILSAMKEPFSEKKLKERPLAVWFYQAFARGGVLDGVEGFIFSVLGGYYEFIRRAKHWELKKDTAHE